MSSLTGAAATPGSANHSRPNRSPKTGTGMASINLPRRVLLPFEVRWDRWAASAARFCAAYLWDRRLQHPGTGEPGRAGADLVHLHVVGMAVAALEVVTQQQAGPCPLSA